MIMKIYIISTKQKILSKFIKMIIVILILMKMKNNFLFKKKNGKIPMGYLTMIQIRWFKKVSMRHRMFQLCEK